VGCLLCGFVVPAGAELAQQKPLDEQTTITPMENGTNYLSPNQPVTEGYERVSPDVSSAASISAQTIHSEHDSQRQGEQLTTADEDNRRSVANTQLDDAEAKFEVLAQRQQELYEAYSTRELSSREFLRNLATLQVEIKSLVESYERAARVAELGIERLSQFETLKDGLSPEQPALTQITDVLTAEEDSQMVYLQGSNEGVVIATVTDDQFTRQATVLSERNFDGRDQFRLAQNISIGDEGWATPIGYSEALSRLSELYPWTYSRTQADPANINQLSRIYSVYTPNPQGELTTYFDGATRNVFHENQAGPVDAYSIQSSVSNRSDEFQITLGLTHDSGPLRVTVADSEQPISDATVQINGTPVGSTDDDGLLWTIQPRTGFEISVTTAAGETGTLSVP
jgi:hypothetical protein